jgi:hypothetical protein
MVPVPTIDMLRLRFRFQLRFQLRIKGQKAQFSRTFLEKILPFYIVSFFTRKIGKFHQIYWKMFMKKGYPVIPVSVKTFVIPFYYGSGSAKIRN